MDCLIKLHGTVTTEVQILCKQILPEAYPISNPSILYRGEDTDHVVSGFYYNEKDNDEIHAVILLLDV